MPKINLYLFFDGKTEAAFTFYKAVFGGEFTGLVRNKDMPSESDVPQEVGEEIANIALPIGDETVLMGGDLSSTRQQSLSVGNNVCISVHPESEAETERIFRELSAGGSVEMPLAHQPWGDFYGSFVDKFGVWWMVNYSGNQSEEKSS